MAKYGAFKYGTTLYGTGAIGTQPIYTGSMIWVCGVYWTGSFTGASEHMIDYQLSRGSAYLIAASGGGFESIAVGTCIITLDNHDGRYDPYNTGSPLYPNVVPGKRIFVDAVDVASGTHYQRFAGSITNIIPNNQDLTVTLECRDTANDLEREDITLPIKFNTVTSDAMADTLAGIGWTHGSSIQTSDNPLTLFTVDEQNTLGVMDGLTQGSLGYCFIDKSGRFVYYDRDYTGMPSHTVDQAIVAKDLPIKSPWDTTRKNIAIYANRWAKTQIKTIWTCPDDILIEPGQTKTFSIELPNPTEILTPIKGFDYGTGYQVIVVQDGGGTFHLEILDPVTVSISNITGKGCTFTIFSSDTKENVVWNLRLRGREYVQSYSTKQQRSSYSSWVPTVTQITSTKKKYTRSNAAAGGKFVLDSPYLQDGNFADAFADSISNALATADKAPTLRFDTRGSQAFPIELGDKIMVTSAKLGINNDFYVLKIDERWTDGSGTGQGYETTIYTGRRIFCTVSITPEPIPNGGGEDPVPTIPVDPILPPTMPGVPPEKYPDACMTTVNAPQTGPYGLQFDRNVISTGQSAYCMFPCGLRKAGANNPSYIDLHNAIGYGNSWYFYQVFALDANRNRILSATIDRIVGYSGYWPEIAIFAPVGGLSVAGFEIFLPSQPMTYTPGTNFYTSQGLEFMRISAVAAGYSDPAAIVWPGITDVAGFHMIAPPSGTVNAIVFDLGATPNSNTGLYVRAYNNGAAPKPLRCITSADNISWRFLGSQQQFNPGTWGTMASIYGDQPMLRYVGFACYAYDEDISIAYAYLADTTPGIGGSINLELIQRAYNICAIPE